MSDISYPLVERSVIALMLQDDRWRRAAFAEALSADHFVDHAPVFEAIEEFTRAGTPIEPETLSAHLVATEQIVAFGGAEGILELFRHQGAPDGWGRWIGLLRESFALRVARDTAKFLGEASDSRSAMAAVKAACSGILEALAGPSRAKPAKQVVDGFLDHFQRLMKAGEYPGLTTGIPELDLISGGMRAGELWTVLAKTSRGKTVLMMQMAAHAFLAANRTAIFSAEMLAHELVGRLASNIGSLQMDAVTKPNHTSKETLAKLKVALRNMAEKQFWIDDTAGMTLEHIEAEAQRLMDENGGLDLVVVDYMQIIQGFRNKGESREQQVARISSGLKQLAKRLRCPILSAAQLNKDGEARESQAIAFDSDAMLAIADDGIKVMKLRNGRRDDVLPYRLVGEVQRFERFIPQPEEPKQQSRGRRGR